MHLIERSESQVRGVDKRIRATGRTRFKLEEASILRG